jgi:hypothetical protein
MRHVTMTLTVTIPGMTERDAIRRRGAHDDDPVALVKGLMAVETTTDTVLRKGQ